MQIQKNSGFGKKKLLVAMAAGMLCLTGYFNKDSQVVKAYDANNKTVETDLNNSGDSFDGYFVCVLLGAVGGAFVTHKFYEITKNRLEAEITRLNKLNQSRTMVFMDPRYYGQGYYEQGYYTENNGYNQRHYTENKENRGEARYSRHR